MNPSRARTAATAGGHNGFRHARSLDARARLRRLVQARMHAQHGRYGDEFAVQLFAIASLLLFSRAMARFVTGLRPLGLRSLKA